MYEGGGEDRNSNQSFFSKQKREFYNDIDVEQSQELIIGSSWSLHS